MNRFGYSYRPQGDNKFISSYPVDFILNMARNKNKITLHGYEILINKDKVSRRQLFKSQKCVNCGIEGNIFILEASIHNHPHLFLYCKKGYRFYMLNCDHIVPKFLGGNDSCINLQTMCYNCNRIKGKRIKYNELNEELMAILNDSTEDKTMYKAKYSYLLFLWILIGIVLTNIKKELRMARYTVFVNRINKTCFFPSTVGKQPPNKIVSTHCPITFFLPKRTEEGKLIVTKEDVKREYFEDYSVVDER